jgi:hypothetical protein
MADLARSAGPRRRATSEHATLREALIDGENSGDAGELDVSVIKSKARRRKGRGA